VGDNSPVWTAMCALACLNVSPDLRQVRAWSNRSADLDQTKLFQGEFGLFRIFHLNGYSDSWDPPVTTAEFSSSCGRSLLPDFQVRLNIICGMFELGMNTLKVLRRDWQYQSLVGLVTRSTPWKG
jgi:hypothetical protein